MEKAKIAVIMTVHNRRDTTVECLKRLYQQNNIDDINLDVYLTDDGCTDGTPEAIREHFPSVNIIQGDGTLFWNRGMYMAWKEAAKKDYDYYLWLNDDTILYDYAIAELIQISKKYNNVCNIVGSCQFIDHRGVSYGGFINDRVLTPTGKPEKVDYFNGNIVLVPDYVYQRLGNVDYYFRHCHGDTDYGFRATENGIENYVVGEYLGECDRNEKIRKCWDPNIPIIERFKDLYKPTGYPPNEAFYFQKKHYGLIISLFHLITLYLRVLFPIIWFKLDKAKI